MNLCWNAKFAESVVKNGPGYCLLVLVVNFCNHGILGESVRDTQNVKRTFCLFPALGQIDQHGFKHWADPESVVEQVALIWLGKICAAGIGGMFECA
jgi:hypothetical protein